jgi:hypothetical protein
MEAPNGGAIAADNTAKPFDDAGQLFDQTTAIVSREITTILACWALLRRDVSDSSAGIQFLVHRIIVQAFFGKFMPSSGRQGLVQTASSRDADGVENPVCYPASAPTLRS